MCHKLASGIFRGNALISLLMHSFLLYHSRGLAFIVGERPEEPEDATYSHAQRRTPEGEYQREQVTGKAEHVVACTYFYQGR